MKVRVLPARELSAELTERWRAIQAADPDLASPYFCPEYTAAVAAARNDAYVGVVEEASGVTGFFPFQRGALGAGDPIGAPLCDFQGIIATADASMNAADLLRGCGLTSWRFDHLPTSQTHFTPYHRLHADSPVIDLEEGEEAFETWLQGRREARSSRVTQLPRKARKLGREVGPLSFTVNRATPDLLQRVFTWKSEQCRRTGVRDFFAEPWARDAVERVLHSRSDGFAGLLSVLHAGDSLVAAHLGMRSKRVWHWWFPVYDAAFARYSPGALLLLELIRAAPGLGIRRIDLGRGEDAYKGSFQTGATSLAEGLVCVPSIAATWRRGAMASGRFWRSPSARPLRAPVRLVQRAAQRLRRKTGPGR